jgi:outer membrane lipoprotein-sorting protein
LKKFVLGALVFVVLVGLSACSKDNTQPQPQNATTSATEPVKGPRFINSLEKLKENSFIKDKVLNANRNYKNLEGTVVKTNDSDIKSRIIISIEQPNRFRLTYTPNLQQPDDIIEAVNDGNIVQVNDSKLKKFDEFEPVKQMLKPKVPNEDEVVPDYNGTFLPVGGINEMIHPEMYIQSVFRRAEINVLGEETFLNRKTTLIQLFEKQSKIGDTQKLWFDNETGMILKTEIHKDGKFVESSTFESISFPEKLDEKIFTPLKK